MNVKEALNGIDALCEGFGKNPPPQEVAQARADVCIRGFDGKMCPYNHLGGFSLTAKAAAIIHAQRQRKLQLKLQVDGEKSLGVCKTCGCYLPLKVFFDTETIASHTSDDLLAKFPDFCWIKKECQSIKPQNTCKNS